MISIYTRTNNILKKEFWKYSIKKMTGKYSGPDAVLDSLVSGLTELHIPFEINPFKPTYKNIHVLSGIQALQDRIKNKLDSQTLIAGPTLVITPADENKIILNKKIDIILTPSDWVKNFYVSIIPEIKNRTYSWPAGVTIPEEISTNKEILILKKNIDAEIFTKVKEILTGKNISFKTLEYGAFKKSEYMELLKSTSYLIYLQKTESQGIALQEAWSYNVPTLVYQNTEFKHESYSWKDDKIAAPYLSNESGLFFTLDTFDGIISRLESLHFKPKEYCQENLSNKKSTEKLLYIIQHHEKNY
ncbi:hypothetical protein H7Y21_02350 [Arenimonas sp.]|nr:hypothetical protein [Candidatus Parcubacteria bacterium]